MNRLLFFILFVTISTSLYPQQPSQEVKEADRIRPITVDEPVEYPRDQISEELESLIQPVLPTGKVSVQADVIKTRFDRHEALKVTIPEVDLHVIEKEWTRFFKKAADGKMKSMGARTLIGEVSMDGVSGEPMDVELQFENDPESVFVWIAMERDSSVVPASNLSFSEIQKVVHEKGLEDYRSFVQTEIEREEKVLKKMNDEYDALVKDNQRMHAKIDNFNSRIETDNEALDANTRNISEAKASIIKLNEDLSAASEENEKAVGKELKRAERDLKNYESTEGKLNTRLLSYREEIIENEKGIIENLDLQKNKILRIREQELLVDAYREKLAKIE